MTERTDSEPDQCCGNCEFWWPIGRLFGRPAIKGTCRGGPPTVSVVFGMSGGYEFPTTPFNEWCAAWKEEVDDGEAADK